MVKSAISDKIKFQHSPELKRLRPFFGAKRYGLLVLALGKIDKQNYCDKIVISNL
jgi:hypothetical protein